MARKSAAKPKRKLFALFLVKEPKVREQCFGFRAQILYFFASGFRKHTPYWLSGASRLGWPRRR